MRKTSIIIVSYNNLEYTKECLESIYKYTKKGTYEILVVDNASDDNTRGWLKKQANLKLILNDQNLGFPKACNQAIKLADKDNDILLLNNDTIVTTNWLKNLKICLNSDSKIGAVGPVCNKYENDQGSDIKYDDFKTMQQEAVKNNISDPTKWEEKVFLIGFCLLIKNEVIKKIKELDEEYSPGYIEDNDLSLRIIELGYKLVLCHDVFIHHYLGTEFRKDLEKFYKILNKNRNYFIQRWQFNTFSFDEVKTASLKIITNPKKVLELNCGIGPGILKLKYMYKDIIIHGIESNKAKRKIASNFSKIYSSLEEIETKDYDYILIGNLLEVVNNPNTFLEQLKPYLSDNGYIIGEISNVASIENIYDLLNDKWYYKHLDKRYYTINDINKLLGANGYKLDYTFSWYKNTNDIEKKLITELRKIVPNSYDTVYYSFKFSRK